MLLLLIPFSLAQDVMIRESLATGSSATDYYGGTFTGSGWRVDDSNSRQMWDFGTQVNRGSVSVTIDAITFENLTGDNNHLIELFDDNGHFSGYRHLINVRVYGADDGPDQHGDIKLKTHDADSGLYSEARGGIQDWDGRPHTWTVTWDETSTILYKDGAELIHLDTTGQDLSVGTLWLPLNEWINGYSAPIGSIYSDLSVDGWEPGEDPDPDPDPDDGDPTTFFPIEDAGIASGGYGDVDDLPVQGEGGSPIEASYLQYDLSSLSGTVTSATLRLHVRSDSSAGGSAAGVYAVSDTAWTEDTLTWEARPPVGSLLAPTPGVATGDVFDVDVTAGVRAGGRVAFALQGSGDDGVHFASKEDGDGSGAAMLTVLTVPADSGTPTDDTAGPQDTDHPGDSATRDSDDPGLDVATGGSCACGATPSQPGAWLAPAMLLALVRRRRGSGPWPTFTRVKACSP